LCSLRLRATLLLALLLTFVVVIYEGDIILPQGINETKQLSLHGYIGFFVDSCAQKNEVEECQIFGDDIRATIGRYYGLIREMVSIMKPDIVDRFHRNNPDQALFHEQEPWYVREIERTLEVIAGSGSILEINTKMHHADRRTSFNPSQGIIRMARNLQIPVHLSSDAHHPDDHFQSFEQAAEFLLSIGYNKVKVLLEGSWQDVPLTRKGLQLFVQAR
jgi:histidinol phosphatase-like PHP family hydrolase